MSFFALKVWIPKLTLSRTLLIERFWSILVSPLVKWCAFFITTFFISKWKTKNVFQFSNLHLNILQRFFRDPIPRNPKKIGLQNIGRLKYNKRLACENEICKPEYITDQNSYGRESKGRRKQFMLCTVGLELLLWLNFNERLSYDSEKCENWKPK